MLTNQLFRGRALLAIVVAFALTAAPASAADPLGDAVAATRHTPDELVASFDFARLPGLLPVGDPPPITADPVLDARIRDLAEARGYRQRPEASGPLVRTDGYLLQAGASAAWEELQAAAAAAGHSISLTSGYRDVGHQTRIFLGLMTDTTDAAIDELLKLSAAPGYSKHHTGYAIDVRSGSSVLHDFATTDAYAWLAANDWANAKTFGWLPSYPAGAPPGGPEPEPWEFVWVGAQNIVCGDFTPTPGRRFCDTLTAGLASDIEWLAAEGITTGCDAVRFCTNETVTRGQAATFLWRLFNKPPSNSIVPFDDVPPGSFYFEPVRWMTGRAITTGTSTTTFSPDTPLTRAEFVTFLWRAVGRPAMTTPLKFDDVEPDGFAIHAIKWATESGITKGTAARMFSPDDTATRAQIAAFLHRFKMSVPG